ncbi:VOC family protein [Streptomyces caniscabiei]|uniref:VOC family protein n=1 Tax=Streptomyces caniscabiei TaxID=2746961 RepID=A0A927L4A8_9ACTN|nr:VOC family protein [Streptomyces caniscabiei]MBD9725044.1 VOC family protein [Streptomyces caniscabiei]MDX3510384.1 VOC family protein [Streptomyces caniscabiei]MDX3720467.1 VOC family protein [Streptomyces caniscabiei]WEO26235.1 VOC family protein [Streptomyces caniscabiei]
MADETGGVAGTGNAPYPEGVPCWVDAQLPDVEAGKRFYGELFGWTFSVAPGDGAHEVWAHLDGAPVAALAPKPDGRLPTVWTVHFATPDAVALTARIVAAGGQVITPPTPVGGLGTAALATDPESAVFGLWQGAAHPGFGRRHEPGTFAWAELYTRDTKAANSFYAHLFHDALFGPDATPDFGRATLTDVFPAEMPPHFLVHFRTEDREAALGAVSRLGGRVQVPPFDTSYGNVAVVTDNQGASFALLQQRDDNGWREAPRAAEQVEQRPDELRQQGDDQREDEARPEGERTANGPEDDADQRKER